MLMSQKIRVERLEAAGGVDRYYFFAGRSTKGGFVREDTGEEFDTAEAFLVSHGKGPDNGMVFCWQAEGKQCQV
jgi:hypothetical protein